MSSSLEHIPPSQLSVQIADIGNKIAGVLSTAVESWRSGDRELALSVRPQQAPIRAGCESLFQKVTQLDPPAGKSVAYVNFMLISKHLERILRHAVHVADQAVEAAPLPQAA